MRVRRVVAELISAKKAEDMGLGADKIILSTKVSREHARAAQAGQGDVLPVSA